MPTELRAPSTVLVTGASSGIGAAFARRFAADGHPLVLVARDAAALEDARESLLAAGSPRVDVLAADLTDPARRALVADRLRSDADPIGILVNNAGLGLGRTFLEIGEDELLHQLELNVTAVLLLTRAVLPGMLRRGNGAVVNVSSIAAFWPASGATYSASKAWVQTFTEGLSIAVAGTGVRVLALCPGLVRTDFHRRAGLDMSRAPGAGWVRVDALVDRALADLARNRVVSVPTARYRFAALVSRLLPLPAKLAVSARAESGRGTAGPP